ncbi:hypothetical protein PO883_33815 [Massilia sp. DJPM01]|uniref:hypothetical protein n=1 Tax=Massilia sp. DJPM01 TaxID=3024404 RepID=UPI00259E200E|nr:hypothetical protein [Massilia sp. DJPM01]MDM5182149.1 hypothetical protein [Massilia sp. DJPM01]
MKFEISLGEFYSDGDERRFFQGLKDVTAIKSIKGVGRGLIVNLDLRFLNNDGARELIALLWRYEIPLSSFRILAEKYKKFSWLDDVKWYWHKSMFGEACGTVSEPTKRTRTEQ